MSQPLLFVSPDDQQIYEVTDQKLVSLDDLDTQIQHVEHHLARLHLTRQKFLDLTQASAVPSTPDTPAQPEANTTPAADPSTPVDTTSTDDTPAPTFAA